MTPEQTFNVHTDSEYEDSVNIVTPEHTPEQIREAMVGFYVARTRAEHDEAISTVLAAAENYADFLEYRHSDELREKLGHLLEEYTERAIEWSQSASSPDIVPLGVDRIIALLDRRGG